MRFTWMPDTLPTPDRSSSPERPTPTDKLASRLAQSHGLTRADLSLAAAATRAGRRPGVKLAAQLAEIADRPPLLAASAVIAGIGLVRDDNRMKRAGLRMMLAVLLATSAAKLGKRVVSRTRPNKLVDEQRHALYLNGELFGRPRDHDLESFPSAHAAGGFAAARALSRDYAALAAPALGGAAATSSLKVLKGDHYPSDIIAGMVLGVIAEEIAHLAVPTHRRRRRTRS